MSRLVVLGGGESGVGTAVLAKVKGYDVFLSDINTYAELGIKNVTSFGVYMDSAYFEAYPDTTPLKEYGEGLKNYVLQSKE